MVRDSNLRLFQSRYKCAELGVVPRLKVRNGFDQNENPISFDGYSMIYQTLSLSHFEFSQSKEQISCRALEPNPMSEKQADRHLGMGVSPALRFPRIRLADSQRATAVASSSASPTRFYRDDTKTFGGELTVQGDPISCIRFFVII